MSRVKENENMRQNTKTAFHGKPDDVLCQIEGQELGVLADISRSLAIIADCCLDTWRKDQVDRFMSMTQKDKKLYCDYTGVDEAAVLNRLRNMMPKKEDKNE